MSTSSSANQKGLGSVAGGAATGAAIGAAATSWSGPGALIGAAVGSVVGGIAGSIGLGNKAKKYAKRARRVQQERERNAQGAQYLSMVREARMARAGSLAASASYGIDTSSLATSALSSIGSQSQYSVQYTANDQRLLELYKKYLKKAGAYSKAAQTTLTAGQISGTLFSMGAAYASAGATAMATAGNEAMAEGVTVGATEITPAMVDFTQSAVYQGAFNSALQSNLGTAAFWNTLASPIISGVNRYNQI